MGKISTIELLNNFFESVKDTPAVGQRSNIDRPELYAYEIEIGKELIDMNVDDLFGLFNAFSKRNGKDVPFITAHSSYVQLCTLLRSIFNFYIDTVEPIKNPLYDKRMKGKEAMKRLSQGKTPLNWSYVENIITRVHTDLGKDRADYIELIMLLFYCGFEKAEDIVTLKANMIDHRNRTVALPGRTIRLNERCYTLLRKFNEMSEIIDWRNYILVPYQNGYFKFIVRESQEDSINERPMTSMCDIINRLISKHVNEPYNTKINYRNLYWLGFYDYLVKQCGEEQTHKLLTSYRDSDDVTKLMVYAREYGIKVANATCLKKYLLPYVPVEE